MRGDERNLIQSMQGEACYSPRFKVTLRRLSRDSWMYLSLESSDRQRPCFLNSLSGTELFAAAVAPPARRLCVPYKAGSSPMSINKPLSMSLIVVYDK